MTRDDLLKRAAELLADVPVDPGVCAYCRHSWCQGNREREAERVRWFADYAQLAAGPAAEGGADAPECQMPSCDGECTHRSPSCTACGGTKVILVYGEPDTCLSCAPPSVVQQALREYEETKHLIAAAEKRGAERERMACEKIARECRSAGNSHIWAAAQAAIADAIARRGTGK